MHSRYTNIHFDCRDNYCSKAQLCLLVHQQGYVKYLYVSLYFTITNARMPYKLFCHKSEYVWTCALVILVILVFLNSSVLDWTPFSNLQNLYRYLKHSFSLRAKYGFTSFCRTVHADFSSDTWHHWVKPTSDLCNTYKGVSLLALWRIICTQLQVNSHWNAALCGPQIHR